MMFISNWAILGSMPLIFQGFSLAKKKLVSISELSELSSVTVSRFQERRKRRARQGNMKQIWSTGHTQDFDPVFQVIGSWNHENSRV